MTSVAAALALVSAPGRPSSRAVQAASVGVGEGRWPGRRRP